MGGTVRVYFPDRDCAARRWRHGISLKHDDATNQNKPAALCIVGFIGGPLSDNTGIFFGHFNLKVNVPDLL